MEFGNAIVVPGSAPTSAWYLRVVTLVSVHQHTVHCRMCQMRHLRHVLGVWDAGEFLQPGCTLATDSDRNA